MGDIIMRPKWAQAAGRNAAQSAGALSIKLWLSVNQLHANWQ